MVEPQGEAQAPQVAQTPQIFIAPSNLPPPKPVIFDDNLATTWESWKKTWTRYEIATGVQKQECIVRVSTLLSLIGEDVLRHMTLLLGAKGRIKTMLILYLKSLMNIVHREHK